MICRKCKRDNPLDAIYCANCGSALTKQINKTLRGQDLSEFSLDEITYNCDFCQQDQKLSQLQGHFVAHGIPRFTSTNLYRRVLSAALRIRMTGTLEQKLKLSL